MSSQMGMRFHRHLASAILTLSKKAAERNLTKQVPHQGLLNDSDVIERIIKSYQNHSSVLKVKNKCGSDISSFDFQEIKAPEVKKFFKQIDIKNAVGVGTTPPKLINPFSTDVPLMQKPGS